MTTEIPNYYRLTVKEMQGLITAKESYPILDRLFYAVSDSYAYGFIRGTRAEKAGQKKIAQITQAAKQER